jgi:hypothetical protein
MSKLSNGLDRFFGYKAMKEMAKYLNTYNIATQAVAIHGTNAENIKSTGGGGIVINGNFAACAVDAELDIATDTEGTETAWATATGYSAGDIRANSKGIRFRCVLAHTSSSTDEPGLSENSDMYWEEAPNDAVNAVGAVVSASGYERWVLITAKSDGTLTMWLAGDQALTSAGAQLKIPQYDPLVYCPVAVALIAKDDAGDLTIGTTALTGDITFYQLTGPVMPHPDNIDNN